MDTTLTLAFDRSAERIDQLPASRAEVAIVGRSNVGKSSLLNAVAGVAGLARTSKTPGRTRLLNCFVTDRGTTVLDLPGYGYAKVSASERAQWRVRLGTYLREREALVMTIVLVDGEVGPTALDVQLLEWMREFSVPFTVVATKHDKVRSSKRVRRRRELAAGVGLDESEVLWVSAVTGVNIDRLRARIDGWLHDPSL